MEIKAVFFDIDGTLIDLYTRQIPESTFRALDLLREKGVKLFICSGRHPSFRDELDAELKFMFDGYIFLNGQWITDKDGSCLYKKAFDQKTRKELYDYINSHEDTLFNIFEEEGMYANKDFENSYVKYKKGNLKNILTKAIYQLMSFCKQEDDHKVEEAVKGCKCARWAEAFTDIVPADGGKDKGIAKVLEMLNITKENTMSFGDGGNDIPMFSATGISIAMGNANGYVKTKATEVTDSCIDDGIYNALKRNGVI